MVKQAIILAGGKGTRLAGRLKNGLPKPLVEVEGVPLLERQLVELKRASVERVVLLVNYKASVINQFCRENSGFGLDITIVHDGTPRGTAGAVLNVLEILDDEFLVVYGDTLFSIDFERFYGFHAQSEEAAFTLFAHPNDHPQDSDIIECDALSRVLNFHPYPHDEDCYYSNLVNAALYIGRKSQLLSMNLPRCINGEYDFGKHLFPLMLRQGALIRCYKSTEYIKDCGTPDRLDRAEEALKSGVVAAANLRAKQKAVFFDRDGVINFDYGHISKVDHLRLLPGVAESIAHLNKMGFKVIVVTNQPVVARGECSEDELREIHKKMEWMVGWMGGFFDGIYFCPHHPVSGFEGEVSGLKIECSCRKPGIALFEKAVADFNIDISKSWFIGDSTVDYQAALAIGLRFILVETGNAGLDGRFPISTCLTVPGVPEATSVILGTYSYEKLELLCFQSINEGDFVFVGGLSRSGKSNLSCMLRDFLERKLIRAHIISIDGWLKPENDREPGVFGRYDCNILEQLIFELASRGDGECIIANRRYDKGRKISLYDAQLHVLPKDVVIIEGTIALHFAALIEARLSAPQAKPKKWFVNIDEAERCKRVINEYINRGMSAEVAKGIYDSRQSDEYEPVLTTRDLAEIVIEL
jgi:D,D-heptose 1,7-bisphosphate phosphatase